MFELTKIMTVPEVLDGLLIGSDDFDGQNPYEVDEEEIINVCMKIVEESGIELEGRGRSCGYGTFHVGGADLFSYSVDENDDGEPCLMIELVEDEDM